MMNTRHLLPNELDLLVDGDPSDAVAPLRAHLAECRDCRARFDELRTVADSVEGLPHFTPKLRFTDGIMSQVLIHEPWYVTAAENAKRFIPASRPMRILAGAGAAGAALLVSGGAAWLAIRGDLAGWVLSFFADRTKQSLVTGAGEVAVNALGADAASTLASGGFETLVLTGIVLAVSATSAVLGFRRMAASSRAQRD